MEKYVKCTVCDGHGSIGDYGIDEPVIECANCNGTGRTLVATLNSVSDAELIFKVLKVNKSPDVEELVKRFKIYSDKEAANRKFYS
jgi:hypothetical protein